MRSRFLIVAAVLALASACIDAPVSVDSNGVATRQINPANGTLDQNIYDLFQLFPKGTSTAGLNRWNNVKKWYGSGKMKQAKDEVFKLSEWARDKSPTMSDPPGDETRSAAAARLTLYMAMYVFDGPSTAVPPFGGGADNAVGIVTPAAGGTIVTPTTNAGVSVPRGAVDEETIVIITENLTAYPKNCSGPLNTKLCQYPRFYHFSQFPHKHLSAGAKFAVCHVNHGSTRAPLEDHDGFRLAHNKPANPSDYTPGSTVVDDIEILPLITQTFSMCDEIEYALNEPKGLDRVLAVATSAIAKFLTPKSAYAIDQGGGGESFEFSDFNDVDPDGTPDNSIYSVTAGTNAAGDSLIVSFTVKNVGTATSPVVPTNIYLSPAEIIGGPAVAGGMSVDAPAPIYITTTNVMSLVPQDTIRLTTKVALSSALSGTYTALLNLGSNEAFPDSNLENNNGSAMFTSGPVILRKTKPIRK